MLTRRSASSPSGCTAGGADRPGTTWREWAGRTGLSLGERRGRTFALIALAWFGTPHCAGRRLATSGDRAQRRARAARRGPGRAQPVPPEPGGRHPGAGDFRWSPRSDRRADRVGGPDRPMINSIPAFGRGVGLARLAAAAPDAARHLAGAAGVRSDLGSLARPAHPAWLQLPGARSVGRAHVRHLLRGLRGRARLAPPLLRQRLAGGDRPRFPEPPTSPSPGSPAWSARPAVTRPCCSRAGRSGTAVAV